MKTLLHNHNATTAACYGCLAAIKLAEGKDAEALFYGIMALVHGAGARKDLAAARKGGPDHAP